MGNTGTSLNFQKGDGSEFDFRVDVSMRFEGGVTMIRADHQVMSMGKR